MDFNETEINLVEQLQGILTPSNTEHLNDLGSTEFSIL